MDWCWREASRLESLPLPNSPFYNPISTEARHCETRCHTTCPSLESLCPPELPLLAPSFGLCRSLVRFLKRSVMVASRVEHRAPWSGAWGAVTACCVVSSAKGMIKQKSCGAASWDLSSASSTWTHIPALRWTWSCCAPSPSTWSSSGQEAFGYHVSGQRLTYRLDGVDARLGSRRCPTARRLLAGPLKHQCLLVSLVIWTLDVTSLSRGGTHKTDERPQYFRSHRVSDIRGGDFRWLMTSTLAGAVVG